MAGIVEELSGGSLSVDVLWNAFEHARSSGGLEAFFRNAELTALDRLMTDKTLEAERAGVSIGRSGVGGYAAGHILTADQRRAQERQSSITLTMLLLNASYRVLHEQAVEALDKAERDIAVAIEDMQGDLDDIRAAMADMEARALRDAEGNIVFMNGDRYVYANGKPLSAEMALSVVATPGVTYPDISEYRVLQEAEADRLHRIHKLEALRDRLDGYRDEVHSNDSPVNPSRLPDVIEDIEAIREEARSIPRHIGEDLSADQDVAPARVDMSATAVPDLPQNLSV